MNNRAMLLLLAILPAMLFAQYNEMQVMMQRAQGYEMRQMYDKANEIYAQLEDEYPGDVNVINRWVRNLLRTSKPDEAKAILDRNRDRLPTLPWTKLYLQVLLTTGDIDEADRLVDAYLHATPPTQGVYQEFANVFAGYQQPESAIAVYQAARDKFDDDTLFAIELARAWQQSLAYDNALDEYVVHLRKNNGYLHYVANQLRAMLDDDRTLLSRLGRLSNDEQPAVRELAALGYVHMGEMNRAFEIYRTLDTKQLKRFADEQYAQNNLEPALRAYRAYIERETHSGLLADARVATARVYSSMGLADSTRTVLMRLYNDEGLQDRRMRQQTMANQLVREMLADLALQDGEYDLAETYLLEAVGFTRRPQERAEAQLQLTRLHLLLGRFTEADAHLASILDVASVNEKLEPNALYLRWFGYWLRGDALADTTLNTMMIRYPGLNEANEALQITLLGLRDEDHVDALREAVRLRELLQTQAAVDTLLAANSPRLALLAGDWALAAGLTDQARAIFEQPYEDVDMNAYARLRLAELDEPGRRERVASFLNEYPSHPLSPLFRNMLRETVNN